MNNAFDRLISRLNTGEERISELEVGQQELPKLKYKGQIRVERREGRKERKSYQITMRISKDLSFY